MLRGRALQQARRLGDIIHFENPRGLSARRAAGHVCVVDVDVILPQQQRYASHCAGAIRKLDIQHIRLGHRQVELAQHVARS